MENLDLAVLRSLLQWRRANRATLLATVIRTWGSSPRPVGSIMALCEGGSVQGSVSGGCIEDDLIHLYRDKMPEGPPLQVTYGVSADEAHRFGLPCGGTLELLLEFNSDVQGLEDLVNRLTGGELAERRTEIATGRTALVDISQPHPLRVSEGWLCNTFGPEFRLLLIGAGQLTEYLATMAQFSGFSVTVCDPREEYRSTWAVPGVSVVNDMPDDVVAAFRPDRRTAIVALTHDPKLDDLALLDALQTDAFYIGAIGSRRNQSARHQRFIEHFDQTPESLARLRGPIGLYIGSKTPAEIAVSVMAELLAVKNGVDLPVGMSVGHAKEQLAPDVQLMAACEV